MSLIEDLNWRHAVKAYDPTKKVSEEDLNKILEAMPDDTPRQQHEKEHMAGIAKQILAEEKNERVIHNLKLYLTEIDKRRGTDWRKTFPWLVTQ